MYNRKRAWKMGLVLSIDSTRICIDCNGKLIYINVVSNLTKEQRKIENEIAGNEKFRDVVGLRMIEYQKIDGDDDYNIFQLKMIIGGIVDEYGVREVIMYEPDLTANMIGLNYVIRQTLIDKGVVFKLIPRSDVKCGNQIYNLDLDWMADSTELMMKS